MGGAVPRRIPHKKKGYSVSPVESPFEYPVEYPFEYPVEYPTRLAAAPASPPTVSPAGSPSGACYTPPGAHVRSGSWWLLAVVGARPCFLEIPRPESLLCEKICWLTDYYISSSFLLGFNQSTLV